MTYHLKNKFHKVNSNLSWVEAPLIIPSSQNELFSDIKADLKESEKLINNFEMQINTSTNIKDPNLILYLKNFKIDYESYKKKYMKLKNEYETENKMKHISISCKNDTFLAKLSWESNWLRWGYFLLFVIMIQFL